MKNERSMKHVSTVCMLALILAFLQQVIRVDTKSSKMFGDLQLSQSYREETGGKEKSGAVMDVLMKRKLQLEEDYSCNCSDYCPDPNSSELEKMIWLENNPIFCKETSRIDIENKPYMAFCFFNCCRKCNVEYYKCVLKDVREYCLKKAYACAGDCVKESLLEIKIKGW